MDTSLFLNLEFWKLISIPFVAGLVGWSTNWVAIKLTFRPLEYRGLWPLGWQGIIPSKATKMGRIFVESTMSRIGRITELYDRLGPDRLAVHITYSVRPRIPEYTDQIMCQVDPSLWNRLPNAVKEQIFERVQDEVGSHIDELMQSVGEHFEELLDFEHMVIKRLTEDKNLINRLFLVPGAEEFRFIVKSGLHFGVLFGLFQLAVWVFFPAAWVLPVFGLMVGYATNWFALNIIFRPLQPRRIGKWAIQGLFLKRQTEVATLWSHLVTREIVTLRNIVDEMLTGPRSHRTHELIREHVKPLVDATVGRIKPVARLVMGADGFKRIKDSVGDKAVELSPEPFADEEFIEERAAVVEYWLTKRISELPPRDFQDLLRPCFEEDEWKLLALGAGLGLLAGVAQFLFVFGGF